MEQAGQSYSSGDWLVRVGSEEEFVSRWTAFIEWTSSNAAGAESFVLVRSTEEPRKFLSLGAWRDQEAQEAWQEMPRMQELLGQCRQLCEEFEFHSYTLAASPSSRLSGTERVAGTVQEGVTATGQTAYGLLRAATGAVADATGRTVEATASGAERAAEAVVFPIEGYDEMNVDEISGRLDDLSVEELQLVRDYEELNKKRKTLLEQMDRKIRALREARRSPLLRGPGRPTVLARLPIFTRVRGWRFCELRLDGVLRSAHGPGPMKRPS